ncbi:unnamed protein product [Rhizophagus irregularis]|nr:unnamed protein product [Rhizophagus irregularis]
MIFYSCVKHNKEIVRIFFNEFNLNCILKQSFWLHSTKRNKLLRPKSQEVIHTTTIIFNLFHGIHILMVLFDAYPNFTMAEIGQDLSRELAIGLALIYPISITYTTPTKESKNELTNNRHYVDINDLDKANSTRRMHNLVWVMWVMIFLISLIYNWYKLFIIIWNHIKALKRKEIVSGTSDMQWTVSTLRRAAIYLCNYYDSIFNNVIYLWIFSPIKYIIQLCYEYYICNRMEFYNTNITEFGSIFFIYKAIKPKTKHSNTSIGQFIID